MSNPNSDPTGNNYQTDTELLSQYGTLSIDPSQVPGLFSALFQNSGIPYDNRINPSGARGSWSQQEDELLKAAVSQLGTKKWCDIARFVPTRTAKQCRERWFNRLDPELKHGPFEQWEDKIIIDKQKEIGNRWSVIAQLLPGRSCGQIKNRWYSSLKSSVMSDNSMGSVSHSAFDPLDMIHSHVDDGQLNPDI